MKNRLAVVQAMHEEMKQPEPNEAVLQACELFLTVTSYELDRRAKMHIELSQPSEK